MKPTFFTTPERFRAWLRRHHTSSAELIVGLYKKASGKPSVTWPEAVDEALCFGWIDGVRRTVSDEAYSVRFTPRRPSSTWSAVNIKRIAELERLGKMTNAGRAAYARRRADRIAVGSFERAEPAKLTRTELARLRANPAAAAFFAAKAPWYQRAALHWIVSAKREETRARRLATLITDSAAGRTIKPLTSKPK